MLRRTLLSVLLSLCLASGFVSWAHAEETPPHASPPDPTWWSNHAINQIAPETFGSAGDYISNPFDTCGPASLAVLINYYQTAPQTVTTLDVMQAVQKAGFYRSPNNTGILDVPALVAAARQFGLKQAAPDQPSGWMDLDGLLARVRAGQPAIVAARYRYGEDGRYLPSDRLSDPINHFIIVFGTRAAETGEQVWVLNTHPGLALTDHRDVQPETLSLAAFQAAWALNGAYPNAGLAIFFEPAS